MCGIAVVLNGRNNTWSSKAALNDFMEQACTTGVLRGRDSTGMFQVDKKGQAYIHKLPIPGAQYAETQRAQAVFRDVDTSIVTVLHHRAATKGAVNYNNSHPFEHWSTDKHLIGVHNGSLTNSYYTHKGKNFTVDSDYALYRIWEEGIEAFKDLNGAYAFVWWENDGKLRVACNGQRSFCFAPVKDKNTMLMASEPGMLYWLASRNKIELESIVVPDNDYLLTFDPSTALREFTSEKIPQREVYKQPSNFPWGQMWRHGAWEDMEELEVVTTGGTPSTKNKDSSSTTTAMTIVEKTTGLSSTDSYLFNKYALKAGQEVEFYPTVSAASPLELIGEVLLDRIDIIGGSPVKWSDEPIIIPATLSLRSPALYDNIKAGQVDRIVARVRGESTGRDHNGTHSRILLLQEPTVVIGDRQGRPYEKDTEVADTVLGPRGQRLSYAGFASLTDGGCASCKTMITLEEGLAGEIGWTAAKEPICPMCLSDLVEQSV